MDRITRNKGERQMSHPHFNLKRSNIIASVFSLAVCAFIIFGVYCSYKVNQRELKKTNFKQEVGANWKPASRMLYKTTGKEKVTAVSTALDQPEITLWIHNEQNLKFEIVEYQFVYGKGWYLKSTYQFNNVKANPDSNKPKEGVEK